MSKLSRNRNPNSKGIRFTKLNEVTDSDEDFVVIPKFKPKEFEDQPVVKCGNEEAGNARDTGVIVIDGKADPVIPSNSSSTSVYFSNSPPIKSNLSRLKAAEEIEDPTKPALCENKQFEPPVPNSNEVHINGALELTTKDRVVCPFCWKKLTDKLTGMSHVKSCGKNLPTDRIFDALQLHEKQIREWEYLGIVYPGFQQNQVSAKVKCTAAKVRGKGNGRKKKDPELDLALALSASLHEEIEDRKRKEKEYLVEIGLEHELTEDKDLSLELKEHKKAISDARSKFRIRFGKETKIKLPKTLPGRANAVTSAVGEDLDNGKRRAAKTKTTKSQLTETPLYKTSDAEKQAILSSRVAEIIESSENENEALTFKSRTANSAFSLETNKRLEMYARKECPLWNLASCADQPKQEFYTSALIESQSRNDVARKAISSVNPTANPTTASDCIDQIVSPTVSISVSTESASSVTDAKAKTKDSTTKPTQHVKKRSTKGRCSEKYDWNPVEWPHVSNVEKDLLRLFVNKIGSDLTLYGREEIPIRAHKLIITARCPKLLDEIVIEEIGRGKCRNLIPITSFSHAAVKSFIWCIYSGQFLPPSGTPEDVTIEKQINEMCQLYGFQSSGSGVTGASQHGKQHQSINEVSKYVEKSVQTDVPHEESCLPSPIDVSTPLEDSSQNFRNLSRRELDLQNIKGNGADNFETFDESDDALILCEIQCSENKDVRDFSFPNDVDGVDENVSNDGSCDLFGDYFPEEASGKVIDGVSAQREDSMKKRSRSVSPSVERSDDMFNSTQLDPWATDNTLLSLIPDAALGIPVSCTSQPAPDTDLLESESEDINSVPKTTRKSKGKKNNEVIASNEKRNRQNSKGKNGVYASQQSTTDSGTGTPDQIDHVRSQPSRTPLLNYSTIDTPILKGELKKYGLKPQPRSKAKLLLRHIYTETHK